MKNTKKIVASLVILGAGFGLGFSMPKGQTVKNNAVNNEITSLRHESERIEKLDHYKDKPATYQEKQVKKLDKFLKGHQNLTVNEIYTVKGLTYENCDAYQDYFLTEN